MKNEFENQNFSCSIANYTPTSYYIRENVTANEFKYGPDYECFCYYADRFGTPCVTEGLEILMEYGYQSLDKWAWLGILLSMAFIYRIFFYLALKIFNRP
jgi:hypothetical protein